MQDTGTYGFNKQDAEALLSSIGGYEYEIPEFMPPGFGSAIKHVYPPAGGIPPATWNSSTERMTPGQASCRVAERIAGQYRPTTETVMVENPVGVSVGITGKPMTIGKNTSGAWTVLVEDCSSGTGGPLPEGEPSNPTPINKPPEQDPTTHFDLDIQLEL